MSSEHVFCILGGVLEAGDVADDPLDMEELESLPLPFLKLEVLS